MRRGGKGKMTVMVCHSFVGHLERCMKPTTFVENGVRTTLYCWRRDFQHWDYPHTEPRS